MESIDLGIDLGTTSVLVYRQGKGIVLREPSVVAYNERTQQIVGVGAEAHAMIGKTPAHIHAIRPMQDGVISDYKMTEDMLRYFIKKTSTAYVVKPRVALCVPSMVTGVEAQAVVGAAVSAGARSVYLLEEPVAAAIGAGLDITQPEGHLILDIGGGTSDVAVLSLGGIVCKNSIRVAGNAFDDAIIKYLRGKHKLLIGSRMAENIKIAIASVAEGADSDTSSFEAKGRNLVSGLPVKQMVTRAELYPIMLDLALEIQHAVHRVLEQTPPELAGDLQQSGLIMTGGGALLHGLAELLSKNLHTPARLAPDPDDTVAIGTGKSFQYVGKLVDGFVNPPTHKH